MHVGTLTMPGHSAFPSIPSAQMAACRLAGNTGCGARHGVWGTARGSLMLHIKWQQRSPGLVLLQGAEAPHQHHQALTCGRPSPVVGPVLTEGQAAQTSSVALLHGATLTGGLGPRTRGGQAPELQACTQLPSGAPWRSPGAGQLTSLPLQPSSAH